MVIKHEVPSGAVGLLFIEQILESQSQKLKTNNKMGQCASSKRAKNFIPESIEQEEWASPEPVDTYASELEKIELHLAAQRDVISLMQSQLDVLIRDEQILTSGSEEDERQILMKRKRKRRRQLTHYRSSDLLLC